MSQTENIAPVALILGGLFFYFVYNMPVLWLGLMVFGALLTWQYHAFESERKEQIDLQNGLIEAKIAWYKRRKA